VGVLAGFGSQVTFFNSSQISGHTSAGVDLYANSQAYFSALTACRVMARAAMRAVRVFASTATPRLSCAAAR